MVNCNWTYMTHKSHTPGTHRTCGTNTFHALLCCAILLCAPAVAQETIREIFVPFEDLPVLLEGNDQHVFLTRPEYEDLIAKARLIPEEEKSPRSRVLLSADYEGTIQDGRASIHGKIGLEVLTDELIAVPFPLCGVSLRSALLDGQPAAFGRGQNGTPILFVRGKGKHELTLDMIAPVVVTAAEQRLQVQLVTPTSTRWRMSVPGNVDIRGGASVISREVDGDAQVTRFELLPPRGMTNLVMSLNNRILLQERVVLARSVLVDELTQSYERLHATVSLTIPHGAVDRFRFALPANFEVTDVGTALLARWAVQPGEGGQRILEVALREATTEPVVLNILAINNAAAPAEWTLPSFRPLDVATHVAVVGVVAEERLAAQSITPTGLIPIDVSVLHAALPASVLKSEPGAERIRPVAAYYAPQAEYGLSASFRRSASRVDVTSNLLFILNDQQLQLRGGFAILPVAEKIFALDISVPAGWQVLEATQGDGTKLPHQVFPGNNGTSRLQVKLPQGAAPGGFYNVFLHAKSTPKGWLNEWSQTTVTFPVFSVVGAQRDIGAVAVQTHDDITVRPDQLNGLTPLAEKEKVEFGWADTGTNLAYRYESQPYTASLTVERSVPRVSARTFHFLRVAPEGLMAHYELLYNVEQARARRLNFRLPSSTPTAITVRGVDVPVKEYRSEMVEGERRWTAELSEPRSGLVRLVVEFQQPLPSDAPKNFALPIVKADGVAYQSGIVSVEGNSDFDIAVKTAARPVDVGELVDAEYQVGTRLLGAYGFIDDPGSVLVDVYRRPDYGLPAAIVQRAELVTLISAHGLSQSAARYHLRTKALFLEFTLPKDSTLWSATVDGKPTSPQREGDHLLIGLPPTGTIVPRDLQIVYETPVGSLSGWGLVEASAPRLLLRDDKGGEGVDVPMADLVWTLVLPEGHRVIRTGGTVFTDQIVPPAPPLKFVAGTLGFLGGGLRTMRYARVGARSESARDYDQTTASPNLMPQEAAPAAKERAYSVEGMPPPAAAARDGVDRYADEVVRPKEDARKSEPEAPVPQKPQVHTTGRDAGGERPEAVADPQSSLEFQSAASASSSTPRTPQSQAAASGEKFWAMQGVRSLPIELVQSGEQLSFLSMGIDPRLNVTLADVRSFWFLAGLLAIVVAIVGLMKTLRPVAERIQFVIVTIVATLGFPALLGLVTDFQVHELFHPAFLVSCALALWYLVVGFVRWIARTFRSTSVPRPTVPPAAAAGMALMMLFAVLPDFAIAQQPALPESQPAASGDLAGRLKDLLLPPQPVKLPADAIVLPYNPVDPAGPQGATKVLVPYAEYAKLWSLAFPDKPLAPEKLPATYAIAGASYTTNLAGDEFLTVSGKMVIEVFSDQPLTIPLSIRDGVLTQITLDGQPARLQVIQPTAPAPASEGPPGNQQAAAPVATPADNGIIALRVEGKGRKALEYTIRFKLSRSGGWRIVQGHVPVAAATALDVTVPAAKTEVRLGGFDAANQPRQQAAEPNSELAAEPSDRLTVETKSDNETLHSAVGANGQLRIQWRPKVAEAQVDQSLTARSTAVLDVQEDGVRLVWRTSLEFRRSMRDSFTFQLPSDFLVERVVGANVRGWKSTDENGTQRIDVTLLQGVTGEDTITLILSRRAAVGEGAMAALAAPAVTVRDAALHQGTLVLRRSPLLDVRVEDATGLTRADATDEEIAAVMAGATEESPLGIRQFQTYRFASVPFQLRFRASPYAARTSVEVQSLLKIADRESRYEARLIFSVENRPRYEVACELPEKLQVDGVEGPSGLEWTVVPATPGMEGQTRDVLRVFLPAGQQQFTLLIRGRLPQRAGEALQAPKLIVRNVDQQSGYLVVQADPAYDVRAERLNGCENVLLERVSSWVQEEQRRLARVAIHYPNTNFAATLRVVPRQARVTSFTITNVRVTPFAIEETVYIQFGIQDAGVREVAFRLPATMRDARITVPLLRQKTVEPIADQPEMVRVKLELQDDVAEQLIVLVEYDRALIGGIQDAPIPVIETGRTDQRFVVLENAGRDEVVIAATEQLDELNRQQSQWSRLVATLGEKITRAYLVRDTATEPRLAFQTKQRLTLETARARIGLANSLLIVDGHGAYRGVQQYHVDNKTEQFLEVELPEGSELWTVRVAGEPVKPTVPPSAPNARHVRVPLIKTAPGDLDYVVELKYGGRIRLEGALTKTRFPLMHTVNIHVEQSQVRLRLPQTHQWFDFGGTMRHVQEEEGLKAGFISYQSKQIEQLLNVARTGDDFTRLRASNNLRQLGISLSDVQSQYRNNTENAELQRELSNNWMLLQQADMIVTENAQQPAMVEFSDNRSVLSLKCTTQPLARAKNVVTQLKGNFDESKPADSSSKRVDNPTSQEFNLKWIEGNRLQQPAKPDSGEEKKAEGGKAAKVTRELQTRGDMNAAAIDEEGKAAVNELGKKLADDARAKDMPQQEGQARQAQEGRYRGGELGDQLEKYQQRLQQTQQQSVQSVEMFAVPGNAPVPVAPPQTGMPGAYYATPVPGGAVPGGGMAIPTQPPAGPGGVDGGQVVGRPGAGPGGGGGGNLSAGQSVSPAVPPQVVLVGMKSLDVDLPQRGIEYKFLTPRGEIEIDARTISTHNSKNWLIIAGLAVGLLIVFAVIRFGSYATTKMNPRLLAVLLVVIGIVSLIVGVLPIFGLIAIGTGIVCAIRPRTAIPQPT